MNFGDDPLGDILSDGSNDSFFEDPKPAAKRASISKTPEKKSVTDLFNISDSKSRENSPVLKKADDWLGLTDTKDSPLDVKKSPSRTTAKLAKKISFDDDDDILGNLGITKRPSSRTETRTEESRATTKKTDLLESILGPPKTEDAGKKASFDNILKESKAKTAAKTTPVLESSLSFGDGPREGRRARRSSGGLLDPLGLFSNEQKNTPKDEYDTPKNKLSGFNEPVSGTKPGQSKSTPNISDTGLPDWLGGSTPIKQSKSENEIHKKPETPTSETPVRAETPSRQEQESRYEKVVLPPEPEQQAALSSILIQQKLAHSHLEYQNTAIALQQQESQLLIALQLKKYEEGLAEMQQKQQEMLLKQEQQFNTLLERQFVKQQIMENNMRLQQERINNHIQLLIAQPPISKDLASEGVRQAKENDAKEHTEVYENIISSLKQRQHEEVFLLEESYKKQISLLEQSLESVEKRLRTDVEKVSDTFQQKLTDLQTQHAEEIMRYKQKIQEIESQHYDEIKQIRENNSRMIEEITYEHSTLIENIKQTKKSETSLFSESNSYLQKLDHNMEVLYTNSKSLQELRTQVESDYGILSRAREESLRAKEQEITMMRATLEKCRESAEKERAELLGLVRSLETKIAEQNQSGREERWVFQQAASTLAARSAALDRESEFNRASIEREREQLKILKESMLAEQEKMVLHLTEEKLSLSAEKSRLETSSKLVSNYDAHKAKTEIEAAIQIAKEAAEMTDKERESLHREKCEVERLKRSLMDQERKLNLRESEVESMMREAERRISEGEKAVFESKSIENKYNERLRDLQSQLSMLANRERKLAEEKISLSRERLALNAVIRQNKQCSLCASDPQKLNENNNFHVAPVNFMTPYFPRIDSIDDEIIRLRLEAVDDDKSVLNMEENVPTGKTYNHTN